MSTNKEGTMSAIWIYGGSDPKHEDAVRAIVAERRRQDKLKSEGRFRYTCADQEMGNHERHTCLSEEVGEVAEAILTLDGLACARARGLKVGDEGDVQLREELVQVAAICLAWLESDCNDSPIIDYTPTPQTANAA